MMNVAKYAKGYFMPPVVDMNWTKQEYINKAPIWCSVDLRDGNQSLVIPMSLDEKLNFINILLLLGLKKLK